MTKPWPVTKIGLIKDLALTSSLIKKVNIRNFDKQILMILFSIHDS